MFPSSIPLESFWPKNKVGVLKVCQDWYAPDRVGVNERAIADLPVGTITPSGTTNMSLQNNQTPLFDATKYAIALNSINYRFWDLGEQGEFIRYENLGKVGALGMTESFGRDWSSPLSLLKSKGSLGTLTSLDINKIFGNIPEPESRARILNEVLQNNPDSLKNLNALSQELSFAIECGACVDTSMASSLAEAFPEAYGDAVLKKAQLAVSSIWREARDRGVDAICEVTAFADYQIPNVLRALDILEYAPDLAEQIDAQKLIEENGIDEQAIRAASILAIEQLAIAQNVSVADVDYWIWQKRKEPKTPFHLTETTAY